MTNNKLDFLTINTLVLIARSKNRDEAEKMASLANKFFTQDGIKEVIQTTGSFIKMKMEALNILQTYQIQKLA
jgi:hypothetical protein